MQMLSSLSPLCTTAVHNDLLYRCAHGAAEIDRHSLTQDGKLGSFDNLLSVLSVSPPLSAFKYGSVNISGVYI